MKYFVITPHWCNVARYADSENLNRVFNLVYFIVENLKIAKDAEIWCRTAKVGETYTHPEFTIEVVEE